MKKRSLILSLLLISSISACDSYKEAVKPTYDGVGYAFNSVKSTFNSLKYATATSETSGLTPGFQSIFDMFSRQDVNGDRPYFTVASQPMFKFRYLIDNFDHFAEQNLEFGQTYYDNMNGVCYLDPYTGEKSSTYICPYNITLAFNVSLNGFGQIKADIGFLGVYVLGGKTFQIIRYTNMTLDYDYESETPTFTSKFITESDETQAPYSGYYRYDYDYFDFVDGYLCEYRNFSMESSTRLELNATHKSFDSYLDENIAYRVNAPKWFYYGTSYEKKSMSVKEQKELGNIFFNLGLFAPISASLFILKASTQADDLRRINTEYVCSRLESACNEDIGSVLAHTKQSSVNHINHANNPNIDPNYDPNNNTNPVIPADKVPNKLKILENDNFTDAKTHYIGDIKFKDLFEGFTDTNTHNYSQLNVWYYKNNQELTNIPVAAFSGLIEMNMVLERKQVYGGNSFTLFPSLSDTILDVYKRINSAYGDTDFYRNFKLTLTDTEFNLSASINLYYDGTLDFNSSKPTFPRELLNMGILEYQGNNISSFDLSAGVEDSCEYVLNINGTGYSEATTYGNRMASVGYSKVSSFWGSGDYEDVYKKTYDSSRYLYVVIDYSRYSNTATLKVYLIRHSDMSNVTNEFTGVFATLGLRQYTGVNPQFEYVEDSSSGSSIIYLTYVYNTSTSEATTYCDQLISDGFSQVYTTSGSQTLRYLYTPEYYIYINVNYYFKGCQEVLISAYAQQNPNYTPTNLAIKEMYIVGTMNNWGTGTIKSSYRFKLDSATDNWTVKNLVMAAGSEFLFQVRDEEENYHSYGYDYVRNMSDCTEFLDYGEDGKIVVKKDCIFNSINAYVISNVMYIYLNVAEANL